MQNLYMRYSFQDQQYQWLQAEALKKCSRDAKQDGTKRLAAVYRDSLKRFVGII